MRLDEINISQQARLLEVLINRNAQEALDIFGIVESSSQRFSVDAHKVYSNDELAVFLYELKTIKSKIHADLPRMPQTEEILDYLITYLSQP
jgi:hypothetical protein